MLILEGPDGGGKTTLLLQLRDRLGWPVAPRAVGSDMQALSPDIQSWIESTIDNPVPTLYDRHALFSSRVYGPVFRQRMNTNMIQGCERFFWQLERLYQEREPIVIYCLPSLETLRRNLHYSASQPAEIQRRQLEQIYWGYQAQRCSTRPTFRMHYNYPTDTVDQLIDFLCLDGRFKKWMEYHHESRAR